MKVTTLTAANGVPFNIKLVEAGERYGPHEFLEALQPLVEFYDARRAMTVFGPLGQFVSRYNLDTFRKATGGINLQGGVDDWQVDGITAARIRVWLRSA